jgi:hypothetical protein
MVALLASSDWEGGSIKQSYANVRRTIDEVFEDEESRPEFEF